MFNTPFSILRRGFGLYQIFTSITGLTDIIEIPSRLTNEVNYEMELGVVVGKEAKNVSKSDALSHVFAVK